MAEDNAYTARMKREAAADEFIFKVMESMSAFLDGHATLHIAPMAPGIGQSVRFVKDTPPS